MLRLFNANAMPVYRINIYTKISRSLKCSESKGKHCILRSGKTGKYVCYSTAQGHKIKLKAKPYEELLKVLEARESSLESKDQPAISEKFDKHPCEVKLKSTSTINELVSIHNESCNDEEIHAVKSKEEHKSTITNPESKSIDMDNSKNEGIYTVKSATKKKKTISPKNQEIDSEKQKKKETSKTKKLKKKPSLKQEDLKRVVHHSYALRALKSYIEVSINADEVEKAQYYLRRQLEHFKKKYKINSITNVDLYNSLIAGWAEKGRLDKIKQVFLAMENDSVAPNLQSYAGYFECLARGKFLDMSEIKKVLEDMKLKGLSYKDILQNCVFKGDQKERVVEALGYIDADLPSPVFSGNEAYSCKLLQNLNDKSYGKGEKIPNFCFTEEDIQKLSVSQLQVEDHFSRRIKSVDAIQSSKKMLKSRKYLDECEDAWRKKLTTAIKNLKSVEKKYFGRGLHKEESVYPYLSVVDNEILVNLLLQEIRLLAETGEFFSPQEKVLYKELGVKVMNHYFIWLDRKNKITEKVLLIYQKYLSYLLDPKLLSKYSPREYWEYLKTVHSSGPTIDIANVPWSQGVLIKIGCELYDILRRNVAFNANLVRHKSPSKVLTQAFYITYEDGDDVKIYKHIRTHHLLCKLYRDAQLDYLEFDATILPMLSPPKPWVKYDSGGLLITTIPLIRFNENAMHQTSYYSNVPLQNLYPCFDSLNSVSLCPWIINKPLLDLIIEVFQKGGNEKLDIPLNPNSFSMPPRTNSTMSKKEKSVIWKQKKEIKKKKLEMTSLWFDCLYKLSIANHFRDKKFWFPHNLDFRGRVYPIPPHFNHLGSDMARSILLFAEGQPLGEKGLDWLKLQLVNLTGFKKRDTHADRLKYADEMIPEIFDSADHPFEGNQWWKTSDKPWQTLACCKELANALRHPNPKEYISHFPVHQDGSCNGLQHYAALGRDELGAIEVNLYPSDAPQDVYSGVSALVERERQKDASSVPSSRSDESEIVDVEVAKALDGFVRRKVVKQTVMTYVYGVTRYGAKLQILKQLKDMPEFPEKYHNEASTYLMKKIFFSIREMFTATQKIQDWFTNCAALITTISGETLEWVTPLGLPVIQPYYKQIKIYVPKHKLCQGNETDLDYMSEYEPYQAPNVRKQKNGFPPNFIHSLDATHMMLTSLFCQRKGITFVSVHDCYWTHASTVEIMNKICREQFVSLHKEPILEDLSISFLNKYSEALDKKIQGTKPEFRLRDLLSEVPEKGTFDLDKVLESEYFFS